MSKVWGSLLLLCLNAQAWTPLVVVPEGGRAALGPLPDASGASMPAAETSAFLSRRGGALVFEVICREPRMECVSAKATKRDEAQVWKDDCVELFVQPKGSAGCVHVAVNSLGTLFDERGGDNSWNGDGIVSSAARETDCWTVTVSIPFDDLGAAPAKGDEWRVNVCRSRVAAAEMSSWSPTGGAFHNPSSFGIVRFSDGPCPADFAWRLSPPGAGRVSLVWPDGSGDVVVTLGGKRLPVDGSFVYSPETDSQLILECKTGGTVVFRTALPIPADPLEQFVRDARRALTGLVSAKADFIQAELDAFAELLASATPERRALFADAFARLAERARNVRAAADFAALGHKAGEIPYGVETSLVKMLKHSPFKGEIGGTIRLDSARNEMDAAQLVLFAGDAVRHKTRVELDGDLVADGGGGVLPSSVLRLRRVGYVKTVKPEYRTSHVGLWPDPLMPLSMFDIAADSFESVWIDVRVPEGQAPSLYRGTLTVTAMNGDPTKVPVEVRVRSFTIPRRSSLTTAFGTGRMNWRVGQKGFLDNLLEHRITPYACVAAPKLVSAPTMDWSGARKLSVSVTPHLPAELRVTLTVRDRPPLILSAKGLPAGKTTVVEFDGGRVAFSNILSAAFSAVMTDSATLEASMTFSDGSARMLVAASEKGAQQIDGWFRNWPTWRLDAWERPDVPAVFDWTEFDANFEKALAKGITSHKASIKKPYGPWAAEYQRHLSEKGWLPYFYTYIFDEPMPKEYATINRTLAQIKEAEPGTLKNLVTARSFPPELPFIDIWCPELYSYSPALSAAEQRKGREVWWYPAFSTHHPFPNVFIDYPALDCRIIPWLTWKHDLDGLLYWAVCNWPDNPWKTGEMFPKANGDGSLLYPGDDCELVDSIRWECLRDGMEDYEVFCLLEAAARELGERDPGFAGEIARLCAIDDSVAASYRKFNSDPAALLDARRKMSDCLEKAVAALGREPVIEGRPRRRRGVTQEEARVAIAKMKEQDAEITPLAPQPQPSVAPQDGLLLHYKFDSDLPYVFDYSGNGRHAIPVKAKRIDGKDGKALQVYGGGYVQLPSGAEILGPKPEEGTIEFMVRPDFDPAALAEAKGNKAFACLLYIMKTGDNMLPDGRNEIGLYIKGDRLRLRLDSNWTDIGSAAVPFKKGQWYRVAIVWKPGDRRLYVDGELLIRNTSPYAPPQLDGFCGALGVHPVNKAYPFGGAFDDFKIWSRAIEPIAP